MSGFAILDLVIGLIFIYFILGLVCSTVQEIIVNLSSLRYKVLEKWILQTFELNNFGRGILDHHLIRGLSLTKKPSYIPSDKFAQAVLDMVHSQVQGDRAFDINSLQAALQQTILLPAGLRRFLLQSIAEASGELTKVRTDLAQWFDDSMDRVSGFYKKRVQIWILFIALGVSIAFKADTLALVKYLYDNPAEAAALADRAARAVSDSTFISKVEEIKRGNTSGPDSIASEATEIVKNIKANVEEIKSISQELKETRLPLGWTWNGFEDFFKNLLQSLIGILITTLAVSLGAPFWFDLMSKLVNLRNSGGKPETTKSSTPKE